MPDPILVGHDGGHEIQHEDDLYIAACEVSAKRATDADRQPGVAGGALAGHAGGDWPDRGAVLRVHRDHRPGGPASWPCRKRRPPAARHRRPLSGRRQLSAAARASRSN